MSGLLTVYMSSFQNSTPTDIIMREIKEKEEIRRKRRQKEYSMKEPFALLGTRNAGNKMVYRSAYQRYFRQPRWDESSVEEFQHKLQYRVDRRSVEHQHQAWLWDSDAEDDNDVEEIVVEENKHDETTQTDQVENETREKVQAWIKDQQGNANVERRDAVLRPQDRIKKESEHMNEDPRRRINVGNHAERPHDGKKKRRNSDRRRQRSFNKKVEVPRELKSDSSHRIQNLESKRYPPFLAYGWANRGPTEYKTHNVLASEQQVYPAALRAAKRRQNVIKQKVKMHEEAIRNKELIAPLGEEDTMFPKDTWMTEYQRNFCKLDNNKRHFGR